MACCLSPRCCPSRSSNNSDDTQQYQLHRDTTSDTKRSAVTSSRRRSAVSSKTTSSQPPVLTASSTTPAPPPADVITDNYRTAQQQQPCSVDVISRQQDDVPYVDRLRRRLLDSAGRTNSQTTSSCRQQRLNKCCRCIVDELSTELDVNVNTVLPINHTVQTTSLTSTAQSVSRVTQCDPQVPVSSSPQRLSNSPDEADLQTSRSMTAEMDNLQSRGVMTSLYCEQIVRANADLISDLLRLPAGTGLNESTSLESTFSSLSEPQHHQQQQMLTYNSELSQSDMLTTASSDSVTSCCHTGSAVAPVVPVNSPVSGNSPVSTRSSEPPTDTAAVADDTVVVTYIPNVVRTSPSNTHLYTEHGRVCRRVCPSWSSTDDDMKNCNKNSQHRLTVHHRYNHLCYRLHPQQQSLSSPYHQLPVRLGSRPPCLGQECSPIRSNPCGAGASSSTTTAGTSASTRRQLRPTPVHRRNLPVPCGRNVTVDNGHHEWRGDVTRVGVGTAASGRRRCHHRCTVLSAEVDVDVTVVGEDVPTRPVVEQSVQKVDQWLRLHHQQHKHHSQQPQLSAPHLVDSDSDRTPHRLVTSRDSTTAVRRWSSELKRKLNQSENDIDLELPNVKVRRHSMEKDDDGESCSLPSGTFTSDEEEDVENVMESGVKTGIRCQQYLAPTAGVHHRRINGNCVSNSPSSRHDSRQQQKTRNITRHKTANQVTVTRNSERRRPSRRQRVAQTVDTAASSGDLADMSSSVAPSDESNGNINLYIATPKSAAAATGFVKPRFSHKLHANSGGVSRSRSGVTSVGQRLQTVRRLTRLARRMHRVAATRDDVTGRDVCLQTLAVL